MSFRPRGRKQEREVPAWKQALQAAANGEGDEDDSRHLGPVEPPLPTISQGEPVAGSSDSAAASATGGSDAAAAGASGGGDDDDDENGEDDDDDDENFDPANYDLDTVNDPAEPEEPEAPADGSLSGTDACRIAVANLAFETKQSDLLAFVSSCGRVVAIEMPDLTQSKRTAFVTYASEAMAQAALALTGRRLPVPGNVGQRKLTLLLAPLGATPAEDGLKYDLLRDSVTMRAGRVAPVPDPTAFASAQPQLLQTDMPSSSEPDAKRPRQV